MDGQSDVVAESVDEVFSQRFSQTLFPFLIQVFEGDAVETVRAAASERGSRTGGGNGCTLRSENDFVNFPLPLCEAAAHGKCPGDVGRITRIFTAHIEHQHVACLHLPTVFIVMEDGRVETGTDDGRVGRPLAAPPLILVLHQGCDLVFVNPGPNRLHGGKVSFDGSLGRFTNQVDFSR